MTYVTFELKKMMFDKKFHLFMLLCILFVIGMFIRNVIFQPYIEKEEQEILAKHTETVRSNEESIQNTLHAEPNNEKLQHLLSISEQLLITLTELRNIQNSKDWRTKLTLENEFLFAVKDYKKAEGDFPLSLIDIEQRIATNEKLITDDIKPQHPTFSVAMPNFLKLLTSLLFQFGAILFVIVITGDILSSEYEQRSIQLLFTQPINKKNIITSKYLVSLFVYIAMLFIFFATAILVNVLFGKKGTFQYPVLIENNGDIEFISIADYLFQGIIVTSATVFMVIILSMFLGLILKHTLKTVIVLTIILFIGYSLTWVSSNFLLWFHPFQYVLANERIVYQNDTVWYQGIFSIFLSTALLFWITKRKISSK
ncbi:ABC transporter permease [Virgibacillus chiguensis]|uniref:ABC-2 family transporter protein n=1 Tax=Virgibacillus chiguensis TaxID=411959 RepID=A0A1M5WRA2_9BACI|nr:ABC transporter permease [Virgibacillus chiguensis]SHH90030.1 ABC-2 family transporter protein [Virgibacillus chiguensis]